MKNQRIFLEKECSLRMFIREYLARSFYFFYLSISMASVNAWDDIDLIEMEYDSIDDCWTYPCPCGDFFFLTVCLLDFFFLFCG